MKYNLMQRDSLSHSFKMLLLLQMKQSHNQEGKEEDIRDLRVEINNNYLLFQNNFQKICHSVYLRE